MVVGGGFLFDDFDAAFGKLLIVEFLQDGIEGFDFHGVGAFVDDGEEEVTKGLKGGMVDGGDVVLGRWLAM